MVNNNNSPKVYIETYGCQMNVNDTEVILSILRKEGYERTENMEEASIILVNTCSVRDNAEQRIWGRIEQFKPIRKNNKGTIVGIVGCMAERLKDKLLESHEVDLVAGPDSYRKLPTLIKEASSEHPQIDIILSKEETYDDIMPVRIDKNGVSAFISIMRGCNNVCSYCIVPYTRGVERSRNPRTIVGEAREAFRQGYREITLLGQNVDSYFWRDKETADDDVNFAQLLEMVAQIDPMLRIRFSTSHPKDISDEVIYTMGMYENICKHIHFPVQSGSDRILSKMRRRYTREWYLERVAKIHSVMPECGLTTDIISGFCSETEEDHKQTLSLMEQVGFYYAYMFQYSERPGTLAAKMYPDDVPPEVKTRRLNEIIALQNKLSLKSNENDLGKIMKVLVEGTSKRNAEELCGRASNNKMCVFPDRFPEGFTSYSEFEIPGIVTSGKINIGDYVMVKAVSCTSATLICELV
ncbi:MAG: tRNA (N6-isopentenyl adenosine(37)-C2)-methylthiotransferase MiaB [Bacteroidales bacterium]|nr:tRNA (N6-isopentenyl adenosine(37)-C2)-methylthiotransferase MiaB [Bacteroidales bacterium]